jgi:Na+-transporting methylmalonyl-CoA/oxaloacetate decarboxylase beta subunit
MDNNKRNIIILVSLGIIIIFGVIIFPNIFPSIFFSFKEASAVSIIGEADGPTSIYISASNSWTLVLLYSSLLFAIDSIILGVLKIIEYKKQKIINLKHILIFMFNIIIILLLFPNAIMQLLILNVIILLIYLIIILLKTVKK